MELLGEQLRPIIFRGTLEECWRSFTARVRSSKEYRVGTRRTRAAYERVAEFCGASFKTVSRWFPADAGLPRGVERMRLSAFLEIQGYQALDDERSQPWVRYVHQMIGFGVSSVEELCALLESRSREQFLALLTGRGGKGLKASRKEIVKNLWLERQRALREKKQTALKAYALFPEKASHKTSGRREVVPAPVVTPVEVSPVRIEKDESPLLFFMQGVSRLLEREDSTQWSNTMKQVALKVTEQLMAKLYPPNEKGDASVATQTTVT